MIIEMIIETKLIAPLTRAQTAALRAEAERYGRFVGRAVRVVDVSG